MSIDDVYKLNIAYQCIKKRHGRDLRWDPSTPYLLVNSTIVRLSVSILLLDRVALGPWGNVVGWVGLSVNFSVLGKRMDPLTNSGLSDK